MCSLYKPWGCFQYIKGTKKKANHNKYTESTTNNQVVSNTSKVLKRKQITTTESSTTCCKGCFQYIKGTKKKANHNIAQMFLNGDGVVSNTSKVLKRKQITTTDKFEFVKGGCFQYIKGTKKKANHNLLPNKYFRLELFPIHQRY